MSGGFSLQLVSCTDCHGLVKCQTAANLKLLTQLDTKDNMNIGTVLLPKKIYHAA